MSATFSDAKCHQFLLPFFFFSAFPKIFLGFENFKKFKRFLLFSFLASLIILLRFCLNPFPNLALIWSHIWLLAPLLSRRHSQSGRRFINHLASLWLGFGSDSCSAMHPFEPQNPMIFIKTRRMRFSFQSFEAWWNRADVFVGTFLVIVQSWTNDNRLRTRTAAFSCKSSSSKFPSSKRVANFRSRSSGSKFLIVVCPSLVWCLLRTRVGGELLKSCNQL